MLAAFGGLSWWVSTEGNAAGYIAAGFFSIMAVLGAIIVYIMIVFEDQTSPVKSVSSSDRSNGEVDPVTIVAAMLVGTSDQFHEETTYDIDDDYPDDLSDIE